MKCIYCPNKVTFVKNSRNTKGGGIVWRRRHCEKCKSTFTTREGTFTDNLFLIKRNGKRVRFVYEKLFVSIFVPIDLGKFRDNGKQAVLAKEITYKVIDKLREKKTTTVSTKDIIIFTYNELFLVNRHSADSYMYYSEFRKSVLKNIMKK